MALSFVGTGHETGLIHQTSGVANTKSGSFSVGVRPAAGNLVIVWAWGWNSTNNATATSVADNIGTGNSFTKAIDVPSAAGTSGITCSLWFTVLPATATADYTLTITCANLPDIEFCAREYTVVDVQSTVKNLTGTATDTSTANPSTETVTATGTASALTELAVAIFSADPNSTAVTYTLPTDTAPTWAQVTMEPDNSTFQTGQAIERIGTGLHSLSNIAATNWKCTGPSQTHQILAIATFRTAASDTFPAGYRKWIMYPWTRPILAR